MTIIIKNSNRRLAKKRQWSVVVIFFGIFFFLFYQGSLSRTLTIHRAAGEGRDHLLFHSTTSTHSQRFRHLFATLHMRLLSHIFNRSACIYQTAARWDLPPFRITIWLTDDVMLIFVCLALDLIRFCYSYFTWEIGGPELASAIIFVLQTNRITRCASHWVRILLYKTNKFIALEMKNSVMQKLYRISQTHLFQHIHDKNFQDYPEW